MWKTPDPIAVTDGEAVAISGLVHRVWEPVAAKPHPTVVMLHGRSGSEDAMWIFGRTIPTGWLMVAPRGIKPDPSGGYTWYPRARNEWPTLEQFEEASQAVHQFVRALPQLYNADPRQVYLMGFSQGAATAYATAIRHPGSVQGIAGLLGFIPVECGAIQENSPLMTLPIFMAAGKRDPLVPLSRTVSCAQTLYMAGAQLEYYEYDTGHRLNAQGLRDLKQWWQARAQEA